MAQPKSPEVPVEDVYHGVTVTENYRWLEDGDAPEVQAWTTAQNAFARQFLDSRPDVPAIRKRVTEIMTAKTISYGGLASRGGQLLAIKREPPKQQPFLVVIESLDKPGSERVLLDPNVMDASGGTSIDWFELSPNGKLVAVSLSRGGSELGDVAFFDVATGKQVHEEITRVNSGTAGGDLAWSHDGRGVYYTRLIPIDEKDPDELKLRQLGYYHELGTPVEGDRYELGRDFLVISEIEFAVQATTGHVLASVQKGDGGEFQHYLRSPLGKWQQITQFTDLIVQASFGSQDDILLISRDSAPRGKLLRMPIAKPELSQATTIIPESKETIVNSFYRSPPTVVATKERLYVRYQLGGPSELRVFDQAGQPLAGPTQQPISSNGGMVLMNDDELLFTSSSYLESSSINRYSATTGKTTKTWLSTNSPVDFSDITVTREYAISKDGTKVPLNILMRKGTECNGANFALVTGYGGYGHCQNPSSSANARILLDQGFIIVDTNLRGGGEFGEDWHRQGNLTKKQNVFDDFAAVLKHLVERKYTTPQRLAIQGGSNGGLLMGATLTQHPELMQVVVAHVGIYDMLRFELSANGAFNITEFGTVKDPEQFRALHAYSPYHHVKAGQKYPAVLFMTGANDPRVDPLQSRKMTARLQAANAADTPILLRTSSNSGHGGNTALSERIEQTVDVYAFLFDRLGVKFQER